MDLFWMWVFLVIVLTCLAASATLVFLWRRTSLRRMETALLELQNQLTKVNSLLDETRARILGAGSDIEGRKADGNQTEIRDSGVKES